MVLQSCRFVQVYVIQRVAIIVGDDLTLFMFIH